VAPRPAGQVKRSPESRRHSSPPRGELAKNFGVRIRELRLSKGLSQAQLGAPYFTRAHVSAIELGKILPGIVALAHFARVLDVRLRDVLPESD
jgi:ribosome-binding protein aMBF1 (putative translation factor)